MKRFLIVVILGVVLAGVSYGLLVGSRTAAIRELEAVCGEDLAWIKTEFELDRITFERVRVLHEAYKPVCTDYCRQIDERQLELARLLATSSEVTPEIVRVITEANSLRARCQTEMVRHFFEVSQAMPPEQGRRYLALMRERTLAPAHSTMVPQSGKTARHDRHVH